MGRASSTNGRKRRLTSKKLLMKQQKYWKCSSQGPFHVPVLLYSLCLKFYAIFRPPDFTHAFRSITVSSTPPPPPPPPPTTTTTKTTTTTIKTTIITITTISITTKMTTSVFF